MLHMPYASTVDRDRPRQVPDPYDATKTVPGPEVDTKTIKGFVGSSSATSTRDATRTQRLTYKSLFCDPNEDVLVGDRIRSGAFTYEIEARPESDVNPFTGWQPVVEIPLILVEG